MIYLVAIISAKPRSSAPSFTRRRRRRRRRRPPHVVVSGADARADVPRDVAGAPAVCGSARHLSESATASATATFSEPATSESASFVSSQPVLPRGLPAVARHPHRRGMAAMMGRRATPPFPQPVCDGPFSTSSCAFYSSMASQCEAPGSR